MQLRGVGFWLSIFFCCFITFLFSSSDEKWLNKQKHILDSQAHRHILWSHVKMHVKNQGVNPTKSSLFSHKITKESDSKKGRIAKLLGKEL